jgi:hypothetical protein
MNQIINKLRIPPIIHKDPWIRKIKQVQLDKEVQDLCNGSYQKETFNKILSLLELSRYEIHHDLKVKLAMADNISYSEMDDELLNMMVEMINTIINGRYQLLKSGVKGDGESHGYSGLGQELSLTYKP